MNTRLGKNRYGKFGTRLIKLTPGPQGSKLTEISIDLSCEGDFAAAFQGENRGLVTTDAMKNLVRALAKTESLEPLEAFVSCVSTRFLANYPWIQLVEVSGTQELWSPITDSRHRVVTAFEHQTAKRVAIVTATRKTCDVRSGIRDLELLKTEGSAFEGFLRDEYTTLPDASARLLRTRLAASWSFGANNPPFSEIWTKARDILVDTFAGHDSRSVQHTLYAMAEETLKAIPEIREVHLSLPNLHCWQANLEPFGLSNDFELFESMDEPFGLIEATVTRDETKDKSHSK